MSVLPSAPGTSEAVFAVEIRNQWLANSKVTVAPPTNARDSSGGGGGCLTLRPGWWWVPDPPAGVVVGARYRVRYGMDARCTSDRLRRTGAQYSVRDRLVNIYYLRIKVSPIAPRSGRGSGAPPGRSGRVNARRLVLVRVGQFDRVAGVADVYLAPAPGRVLGEPVDRLRTVPTVSLPGRHAVREMTCVAVVVQRELLDRLVAYLEVVEFVIELPLAVTPLTRNGRHVVRIAETGRTSLVAGLTPPVAGPTPLIVGRAVVRIVEGVGHAHG